MTSNSFTAEGHPGRNEGLSLLATVSQRIAEFRASWRQHSQLKRLCAQFEAMDDRLLRDIGLDEVEIARLRSGERFQPSCMQL